MLSIPCLITYENQYFRKKCTPDVSELTLQAALDAVANHANCASVTLEDGLYSGRETLELFASPSSKNETSYRVHCEPPPPPPPPLIPNWWESSPPPTLPPPPSPTPSSPTPSPPPFPPPPPAPPLTQPRTPPSPSPPPPPHVPPPPPSPPPQAEGYNANLMTALALFIAGGILVALLCIAFVRSQFLSSSTPPPPQPPPRQSQPTAPRRTDRFVRINL